MNDGLMFPMVSLQQLDLYGEALFPCANDSDLPGWLLYTTCPNCVIYFLINPDSFLFLDFHVPLDMFFDLCHGSVSLRLLGTAQAALRGIVISLTSAINLTFATWIFATCAA